MNHDFGLSHSTLTGLDADYVTYIFYCTCGGWSSGYSDEIGFDKGHAVAVVETGQSDWRIHRDEAFKPVRQYHDPRCDWPANGCACAALGFDQSPNAVNVITDTAPTTPPTVERVEGTPI